MRVDAKYDSRDEGGNPLYSDDDYEFAPDMGLRGPTLQRKAFDAVEWHADSLQRRCQAVLQEVDRSGVWTLSTTAVVIAVSGLNSLYDLTPGAVLPLTEIIPAWIPRHALLNDEFTLDPVSVASAEDTLQAIFLFEYVLRAWSENFSLKYLRSPTALVDFAAILPSLESVAGAGATTALRPLRLFRLLRLLRLTSIGGDEGGDVRGKEGEDAKPLVEQVTNVAVEFLCVFLIAGELFYDIEYEVNPNISDIGDALYWSFLTLTGIGQPFEAVTAAGRVATVVAILTALVVVPLQLANLVGAANAVNVSADGKEDAAASGGKTIGAALGVGFGPEVTGFVKIDPVTGEPSVDADALDSWDHWDGRGSADAMSSFVPARDILASEWPRRDQATDRGEVQRRSESGNEETAWPDGVPRLAESEIGMRGELLDARRRLRAFEAEVDLLREENARLRARMRRAEGRDQDVGALNDSSLRS